MYRYRTLEPFFRKAGSQFPVLLLTGPRQVGKTTVLKHLCEKGRSYVTLDNVYDAMTSYFTPQISSEETQLLDKLRKYAKLTEEAFLPGHYHFLDQWAPGSKPHRHA